MELSGSPALMTRRGHAEMGLQVLGPAFFVRAIFSRKNRRGMAMKSAIAAPTPNPMTVVAEDKAQEGR